MTSLNSTATAFFGPIVSLQNVDGNPRANANFGEVSWTLKQAETAYGISARNDLGWLADAVRANVGAVRSEISQFRAARLADPVALARRCFLFAIVSPQCKFAENVAATQNLIARYDSLTTVEAVLECLRVPYNGTGAPRLVNLGKTKAARIFDALPWLDRLTADNVAAEFTYESIIAQAGMAEKTTAMTLALFDDRTLVFTLDQWMFRLTSALAGQDPRAKFSAKMAGYKLTEGDWLAWSERFLPDLTPFEVQWTLWDLCFGSHMEHLGILG